MKLELAALLRNYKTNVYMLSV